MMLKIVTWIIRKLFVGYTVSLIYDPNRPVTELDTLRQRVKKLEEALEQLADDKGSAYWTPEEVRQIANEALKGEK